MQNVSCTEWIFQTFGYQLSKYVYIQKIDFKKEKYTINKMRNILWLNEEWKVVKSRKKSNFIRIIFATYFRRRIHYYILKAISEMRFSMIQFYIGSKDHQTIERFADLDDSVFEWTET